VRANLLMPVRVLEVQSSARTRAYAGDVGIDQAGKLYVFSGATWFDGETGCAIDFSFPSGANGYERHQSGLLLIRALRTKT